MESMREVLEHELKDLYSAETQLVKALPKMAKGAADPQLRQAFEQHLAETEGHVARLEQIAEMANIKTRGHKCKGMEGLIAEGSDLLSEEDASPARDAALISAAQRVEHYEMAAYGSAKTFADLLGEADIVEILEQTLEEEKAADEKLTQIAESHVNDAALSAESGMQNEGADGGMAEKSATSRRSR
jgi:ferritin-like metal-binding protein YciE